MGTSARAVAWFTGTAPSGSTDGCTSVVPTDTGYVLRDAWEAKFRTEARKAAKPC